MSSRRSEKRRRRARHRRQRRATAYAVAALSSIARRRRSVSIIERLHIRGRRRAGRGITDGQSWAAVQILVGWEQFTSEVGVQTFAWERLALRDSSDLVVVDNDVDMDIRWYAGLFKMICAAGKPTLVCARFERPGKMVDLGSPGVPDGISGRDL